MLRITKPGGFLLCFGGTRTFHRLTCAIEDAGWEIRDCMMWLYGSGFPKSHDISKAIDKKAGAKREVVGKRNVPDQRSGGISSERTAETGGVKTREVNITTPATPLAQLWNGYGTALKPAWEPIIVAMKPLDGTFAANAEKYGVAGLNIDGGRIGTETITQHGRKESQSQSMSGKNYAQESGTNEHQGRWPANLILDEEAGKMLDEQSGISKSVKSKRGGARNDGTTVYHKVPQNREMNYECGFEDSGGASRFFYCAKTSKRERNLGMEDQKNNHPTVKPLALIKYLCTLLKMPGQKQVILDPFMGSGTTGMACKELGINYIGIEKESEYCDISVKRIAAITHPGDQDAKK